MGRVVNCSICRRDTGTGHDFCKSCARSFDRWHRSAANDGTHWSLMSWVARRVWRAASRAQELVRRSQLGLRFVGRKQTKKSR